MRSDLILSGFRALKNILSQKINHIVSLTVKHCDILVYCVVPNIRLFMKKKVLNRTDKFSLSSFNVSLLCEIKGMHVSCYHTKDIVFLGRRFVHCCQCCAKLLGLFQRKLNGRVGSGPRQKPVHLDVNPDVQMKEFI